VSADQFADLGDEERIVVAGLLLAAEAVAGDGIGVKLPSRRDARRFSRNRTSPSSRITANRVTASTPAVADPLLPATRCQACMSVARSQTKLNRSANRRCDSVCAHRCNLRWCSGTRASAWLKDGHSEGGSPPFGGDSSVERMPLITLSPFAMCRAFPGTEYYGDSATT
jgi:hypothetical protein